MANTVSGGTWTISDPAVVNMSASTGVVTGLSAGAAITTYTTLPDVHGGISTTEDATRVLRESLPIKR